MDIDLCPTAQRDIRRFGIRDGFMLERVLRGLRRDLGLAARLQRLPFRDDPPLFRLDLSDKYVARVRIGDRGLIVERIVTVEEINDTAKAIFQ